jgi:hypothetical protein
LIRRFQEKLTVAKGQTDGGATLREMSACIFAELHPEQGEGLTDLDGKKSPILGTVPRFKRQKTSRLQSFPEPGPHLGLIVWVYVVNGHREQFFPRIARHATIRISRGNLSIGLRQENSVAAVIKAERIKSFIDLESVVRPFEYGDSASGRAEFFDEPGFA